MKYSVYQGIWRVSPEFRRNRPKKDGVIGSRTEEPDIRRNQVTRSKPSEIGQNHPQVRDILWIHSDGAHFVLRKLENHLKTNYIFIRFTLQYSTMKFRQSSFSSSVLKHLLLKHLSIIIIFFSIKVIKVFRLKCILTYKRAFPR